MRTGRENLELVGRLYHLGRAERRQRAGRVLEQVQLAGAEMIVTFRVAARSRAATRSPRAISLGAAGATVKACLGFYA